MSSRKRKRRSGDLKCILFPDDIENSFQRAGREPLSAASSSRGWQMCGDGFRDSTGSKSPGRKLSSIKELVLSSTSVPTAGASQCEEDIAWSSSDSRKSEDEAQERRRPRPAARQRRARRPAASVQPSRVHPSRTSEPDDFPAIDTDSDVNEVEESDEVDSGPQISDCDSESCHGNPELVQPSNKTELEISDYASDSENTGRAVTPSGLGSGSSPSQAGERSVSDWVRYAQALLQTPPKPTDRHPKTPDDSAKKKRKFLRGGLADRLSRLQSRQRSAVSFWRHQALADGTTATADRPGVLVLEVLEVLEECSMRVARCEHRRPCDGEGQSEERAHVLVLFSRETVAHLNPAPKDIIHIYPPWQSLSIEGFSCSIILNTHLSQKVHSAPKPSSSPAGPLTTGRCPPYFLCQTFKPNTSKTTDGSEQVTTSNALSSFEGSGAFTRLSLSLLEVVEGLGQAGCVGQDVEVVIQRVYAVAVPDSSRLSFLKPRVQSGTSCPLPSAEKGKTRLCVLVQDSYGMFSVVQLHLLPCRDDLHHYCRMWQGRTCVLTGIKVVQRVTRERCSGLFSLIDSLWPPVIPLRDHRNPPSTSSETRAAGPAPSFCYLLSGQESSVQLAEGSPLSPLHSPPTTQTLRDILQGCDVGQGEVWLVLTDPSLQEEKPERPCGRTAALCVSTSCALTSSVVRALNTSAACRMSFRDVVRDHGVLHCVEQSVIETCTEDPERSPAKAAESLSASLAEPPTLPRPVRLDPLSPEITPNSLCSLTGVIVGVDEDTAYSWPVCNRCRSEKLEILTGRNDGFCCLSCKTVVDKPDTRIQLEVFLSSSFGDGTLKVKLQQKTIASILDAAAPEAGDFTGYDVESVLGKEVGPLAVYVRAVTRKPALWMGLEEISPWTATASS